MLTNFLLLPRYEYLWMDGEEVKKPIKCSAPEYVDYLMTWVQGKLDNEQIFPSRTDVRDSLWALNSEAHGRM